MGCTGNAFSYSSLHRRKVMEADYGNPNIYSALQEEENKLDNRALQLEHGRALQLDHRALENVYDEISRGVPTRASRKSLESKSSKSGFFSAVGRGFRIRARIMVQLF
jgi:hypothetical protein